MSTMSMVLAMVEKDESPVFCLIDRSGNYCPEAVVHAINTARLAGIAYIYATLTGGHGERVNEVRDKLNYDYVDRFIGDVSGMEIEKGEFFFEVIPINQSDKETGFIPYASHKIVVKYTRKKGK